MAPPQSRYGDLPGALLRHRSLSDECPASRSVGRLHALDLDRIAVNRAGDGDFLADVPFDLRSPVDFQHLVIHDEDGSRATLYALRGTVLVLRARAFDPTLRIGDPAGKLVGHGGNRK